MKPEQFHDIISNIVGIEEEVLHRVRALIDSGLVNGFGGVYPNHQGYICFYQDLEETVSIVVQHNVYQVNSHDRSEPVFCKNLEEVQNTLRSISCPLEDSRQLN